MRNVCRRRSCSSDCVKLGHFSLLFCRFRGRQRNVQRFLRQVQSYCFALLTFCLVASLADVVAVGLLQFWRIITAKLLLLSFCFDWEDISNISYPNTSNVVKNTPLCVEVWTLFSVMKHCILCLMYYLKLLLRIPKWFNAFQVLKWIPFLLRATCVIFLYELINGDVWQVLGRNHSVRYWTYWVSEKCSKCPRL